MRVEKRRLKTEADLNFDNPSLISELPFTKCGKGLQGIKTSLFNLVNACFTSQSTSTQLFGNVCFYKTMRDRNVDQPDNIDQPHNVDQSCYLTSSAAAASGTS